MAILLSGREALIDGLYRDRVANHAIVALHVGHGCGNTIEVDLAKIVPVPAKIGTRAPP